MVPWDKLPVEKDNECLAMRKHPNGGVVVVRPTLTPGEFAVIHAYLGKGRIIKILPTLERARAYLAAVVR